MYRSPGAEKSQPEAERKSSILVKLGSSGRIRNICGNWTRQDILKHVLWSTRNKGKSRVTLSFLILFSRLEDSQKTKYYNTLKKKIPLSANAQASSQKEYSQLIKQVKVSSSPHPPLLLHRGSSFKGSSLTPRSCFPGCY